MRLRARGLSDWASGSAQTAEPRPELQYARPLSEILDGYWLGTRRSSSQEEGWATKWGSARNPQWSPGGIYGS